MQDRSDAVSLMLKLSPGHVKFTILPLTIQGTESLLKALKEGYGEVVLVILPHRHVGRQLQRAKSFLEGE